ncbi:NAD(P)-binding protein [Cucurbitaria berberidis CBS 394.84]|uniref:NAD(P)-binding protein n=1 Tax=Cucurbitaria berberidis CBS 394.84 TaxID=1168544 RepID=A0A9P4L9T1_9PLEO|nr:NAD(P)-binding protein [Cucurbitaria berberidis CBS 394.84]KAF1847355.1 NAD(P)-binding protein [Cucurbitaria berberidis CBS 394.84]
MTRTIAIIGVTGNQGSSTARVFLDEPGWIVRSITRDPSKDSAKRWTSQGVEIIAGDLVDLNSLKEAFYGVNWNLRFDAKAEAVNYLRVTYPELWAKTSLLQLGYYANNWMSFSGTPKKEEDGSFKVSLPMSEDRRIPIVDPVADTGSFVKTLVDLPPGQNLLGAGSYMSFNEWCTIFSKANNVTCSFEQMSRNVFEDAMGPVFGLELGDRFEYFDKFGFNGEEQDHSGVFPWELGVTVKYTTMEEYMEAEDWNSVL